MELSDICRDVRRERPLVLNLTNDVAMNFTANALLAIGARPLMSLAAEEMEELVGISSAVVVNIGSITNEKLTAMKLAGRAATTRHKPWVLDPVGAGASRLRTDSALQLLEMHPSVLRGNAAEIMALAGCSIHSKGVDSDEDTLAALPSAKSLAGKYGCIVSVSGEVDRITDGNTVMQVTGGDPIMSRVTAMGCTATAITAAFCAVCSDFLEASFLAMSLMSRAGEKAAASSSGHGSMAVAFLDALGE